MFQEHRTDHKPSPNLPHYLQNSSKTSTADGEMQFGDKEQRLVGPTGGELNCLGMFEVCPHTYHHDRSVTCPHVPLQFL